MFVRFILYSILQVATGLLFYPFLKLVQINFIFSDNVYILYIYAAV
jgi:hypothetical protein